MPQVAFLHRLFPVRGACATSALVCHLLAVASCGSEFTSIDDPNSGSGGGGQGQAGQQAPGDASPQGTAEAATVDRQAPKESGPPVNPNATIACSNEACKPGPEICCMQNSNDLPDFCVGGIGHPSECKSDVATVTVLECDDGEDCALLGKPGNICCGQARTFFDPTLPVWANIRCVAKSNCLKADDDVFCGSNQADCPAGKTCSKHLGPYTFCE